MKTQHMVRVIGNAFVDANEVIAVVVKAEAGGNTKIRIILKNREYFDVEGEDEYGDTLTMDLFEMEISRMIYQINKVKGEEK